MTDFVTVEAERPDYRRDRWGRPIINGKPYGRASSAAKVLADTYGLEMWQRRNVAYGLAADASLVARMLAVGGDPSTWGKSQRDAIAKILDDAATVAQAHKAADIGTALHALMEQVDRGDDVNAGPYQADIDAYRAAMDAAGLTVCPEWLEVHMVCHDLELAGSADNIVKVGQRHAIADKKTGKTVNFATMEHAAQLAAYAHGVLWDVVTDTAMPTPNIDTSTGYIIHVPAGQGRCEIHALDLEQGYRAAELAASVKVMRKESKSWSVPAAVPATPAVAPDQGRRASLLERHGELSDGDKVRFGELMAERGVAKDDLDGIEQILADVAVFADAVAPPRPAKTSDAPAPVAADAPVDEGADIGDGDIAAIRDALEGLDPSARSWVTAIGARIRLDPSTGGVASVRRFELLRGLIALAGGGFDDEDVLRGAVGVIIGDDAHRYAIEADRLVASLGVVDAARFAHICDVIAAGNIAMSFTADGRVEFTPPFGN